MYKQTLSDCKDCPFDYLVHLIVQTVSLVVYKVCLFTAGCIDSLFRFLGVLTSCKNCILFVYSFFRLIRLTVWKPRHVYFGIQTICLSVQTFLSVLVSTPSVWILRQSFKVSILGIYSHSSCSDSSFGQLFWLVDHVS